MSALGHDIRNALTLIALTADEIENGDADGETSTDLRAAVGRIDALSQQVDRDAAQHEGTREANATLRGLVAQLEARLAATEHALDERTAATVRAALEQLRAGAPTSTGGDRSTSEGAGASGGATAPACGGVGRCAYCAPPVSA